MNRVAGAAGRVLIKQSALPIILLVLWAEEHFTGRLFIGRTAWVLFGFYAIYIAVYVVVVSIKSYVEAYRDTLLKAVATEKEKRLRCFVEDPQAVLELTRQSGSLTTLKRLAPYLGKWMTISGRFEGIADALHGDSVHVSILLEDGRRINLRFAPDHRDRLMCLREGECATAVGRIDYRDLTLIPEDCELVRVEPARGVERFESPCHSNG
jgi:hypothetical protein